MPQNCHQAFKLHVESLDEWKKINIRFQTCFYLLSAIHVFRNSQMYKNCYVGFTFTKCVLFYPKTQMSLPTSNRLEKETKCNSRPTTDTETVLLAWWWIQEGFSISKALRIHHSNSQHNIYLIWNTCEQHQPTAPSSTTACFCWHSSSVAHWPRQRRGLKRKSSPCHQMAAVPSSGDITPPESRPEGNERW